MDRCKIFCDRTWNGHTENFFVGSPGFSYPKSLYAVMDCLSVSGLDQSDGCLDYFGGSGTTAHAVIALNRGDGGKRRYTLVEQGDYFDTVLKPRIQKVVYSADWTEGRPVTPDTGISHGFKVLKIEVLRGYAE